MGFSQKHVARLLGQKDASMVSRYERERSLPPLAVALGLSAVYRVPVEFLFHGMYVDLRARIRELEDQLKTHGQQTLFQVSNS
jgi:transcriptional regulator with XRE-family HTH domain